MAEKIEGFYLDGVEYTFGSDGYERSYLDYSAVKGPAPTGFHVPSIEEWQGVNTIMRGLGLTTGDNWRINLHMPLAGCRSWGDSIVAQQGSQGHYWTYSTSSNDAFYLYMTSSFVMTTNSERRGLGDSIRAFKDSFVAPTSSWTVINGTLGSAGIFWNQTDGLISITSDGNTGYTIQDKNLGATTVYNDGASLTQANMGNLYQWGNNYGFSSTGNVTTSTTPVDTQNYGPGNYYNGSTFIKTSSNYRYDWSSNKNDNLWGGVTGVQTVSVSGKLIIGDDNYKIVISTTAPANGTPNYIITISTGSTKGLYVGTTKIA